MNSSVSVFIVCSAAGNSIRHYSWGYSIADEYASGCSSIRVDVKVDCAARLLAGLMKDLSRLLVRQTAMPLPSSGTDEQLIVHRVRHARSAPDGRSRRQR